jgi:hypothetical protein
MVFAVLGGAAGGAMAALVVIGLFEVIREGWRRLKRGRTN